MKQWRRLQVSLALLCGVALVVLVASIIVREWTPLSAQGSASTSSEVAGVDEVEAPASVPSETTPDIAEAEVAAAETEAEAAAPAEQPADDADAQPASDNTEQPQADTKPETSYSYTAQPGDSYTALARQAIASYTESRDIALSAPQVLAAEVALANAAGSPELEIGQTVALTPEQIAQAVPTPISAEAQPADNADDTNSTPSNDSDDDTDYRFTAAAGSSYTLLARDAVQQYAKARNVELTPAQRIYAESRLTTSAGSPLLDVGQQVTIARSAVAAAVDAAQQLGTRQQVAWQHYATLANL